MQYNSGDLRECIESLSSDIVRPISVFIPNHKFAAYILLLYARKDSELDSRVCIRFCRNRPIDAVKKSLKKNKDRHHST